MSEVKVYAQSVGLPVYQPTTFKDDAVVEELKALIRTGCAAAVYTQTTDVEGEVNGLITYDRAVVKADMNRISSANKAVIKTLEEELN